MLDDFGMESRRINIDRKEETLPPGEIPYNNAYLYLSSDSEAEEKFVSLQRSAS